MRKTCIYAATIATTAIQLMADVDFTQDIRPILSDKCFACHGPDKKTREAKLRLDTREGALADHDGVKAIVPGNPEKSELIYRITTEDKDDLMPPPKHVKKPLSKKEIALFRQWIQEGASYEQHWSYRPVSKAKPPLPANAKGFVKTHVDAFILDKANNAGFKPSPQADPTTLARRLFLDLVGMPPRPGEIQFYLDDPSEANYSKLLDRLLADKRFGERMAVYWLDLVRYADTIGYHSDNMMEVSAYRDYVINAFNNNLPYDQFALENLAGDLLPESTIQQKVASGYNRLLQTTEEGGAQADEYVTIYQADRVRNFSGVWLGATMGCSQCHDHKYDPYTMKDFYSMAAFFADLKEKPLGRRSPNLKLPTKEQEESLAQLRKDLSESEKTASPILERIKKERKDIQKSIDDEVANADYKEPAPDIDNEDAKPADPSDPSLSFLAWEKKHKSDKGLPKEILDTFKVPAGNRNDSQKAKLLSFYITRFHAKTKELFADRLSTLDGLQKEEEKTNAPITKIREEIASIEKQIRTMLVSEKTSPRMVRILARGDWLDKSGEEVSPAIPEFLGNLDTGNRRADRLDLAKWVVSKDNPLTARTQANRLWKLFMGYGLARKLDDLGGQGEYPTHPALLDWLAHDFKENGWNQKRTIRQILLSSTYRQSSLVTPEMQEADPANRLFLRQSRFRMDAEFVRDTALHLSGLLHQQIGGESVKPYQPAGYWQHLNFPRRTWDQDKGESLYRRSLYTFRCRSFPHPALVAFDATSREECSAERPRSNIPQQALVLLNDPTFVESSRAFAGRIIKESGTKDSEGRIKWAFNQILSREPTGKETTVLSSLLDNQAKRYKEDPASAKEFVSTGSSPVSADLDIAELAAWTSFSRTMFNLYETTARY